MFNFCFFPNWAFGLKECTFHNSILDSWKSGFLFIPDFFSTKKLKNVAQGPKILKKFYIVSEKIIFVLKCPIDLQNWQSRWKFLAKRLMNFSSKYRKTLRKAFFSNNFSACVKVSFESPTETFCRKAENFSLCDRQGFKMF